ncbi:MAG: hypothetical protein RPR91_07020, partial [Colwellia sp.]
FVVKSWVSDGKGNTDSQSYTVQVISPFTLSEQGSVSPFTQLIPRIGDSWFVNERTISNAAEEILVETNSKILQTSLLGNRLVVLIEEGIEIYDSELDFQRVAYHPMADVSGFIHNGADLWLWAGSKLSSYHIFGNDLKFNTSKTLSSNILSAKLVNSEPVLQLTSQLYSVSKNSYISFDDTIQWITSFNNETWLQTQSGELYSVNNKFSLEEHGIKTQGLSALNMAGYLAWLDEQGQLWLAATHLNDSLQVLGGWQVSNQGASLATLSNGQLHLNTGETWSINQDVKSRQPFLESSKQGGSIAAMQWYAGKLYVAGDYYGAYSLQNTGEQWKLSNASAPYSEKSKHVIATSNGLLLSSTDNTRVNLVQSDFTQVNSLFRNIDPVHVASNGDLAAVSNGIDIIINSVNSSHELSYKLPDNIKVQAIAWTGRVLWITGDNGNLYELYLNQWPINEYDLQLITHDIQLMAPVIEMVATSGKIWLRQENALQQYNTQTHSLNNMSATNGQVTAISKKANLLWVAYETQTKSIVRSLDMSTDLWSENSYEYTRQITALAINAPYLAVGFIDGDIRIEHLSNYYAGQVSVELHEPSPRQRYQYAQQWDIQLPWSANAVATNIYINGQVQYGLNDQQASSKDLVPGWLLNGQAIKFDVETQDIFGRVHNGSTLSTFLQSQSLPENDMQITLSFDGTSYYPAPLIMVAKIENTQQPIQLVEYYLSANSSGPYELIAKHRGPQFILNKNFDLSKDGHWVKARAIDIYGNFTESTPKVISRLLDTTAPTLSSTLSGKPVVNQSTVVSQSPYLLNINAEDSQSGLQSILLYRDEQLIKAIFGGSLLSFEDISSLSGENINYLIKAKDVSENETQVNKAVVSIENQVPTISSVRINNQIIDIDNQNAVIEIIEGGNLSAYISAKDDVALASVTTRWILQKQNAATSDSTFNKTFKYIDQRSERVKNSVVDNFNILLTDSTNKQTEVNIPVRVVRDQVPDASKLIIDVPQSGIYGQALSINLSGIENVDDNANSQITFQVLQGDSNGEFTVVKTIGGYWRDNRTISVSMPSSQLENNNYKFKLRVLDKLEQYSDTQTFTIPLTKRPNQVHFTASGTHNSLTVTPDVDALYQVRVLDDVSRPVPNQSVQWAIQSRSTNKIVQLGTVPTDTLGNAQLLLDTNLIKGSYLITAKLVNYSDLQPAQLPITIEAGQLTALRASYAAVQEVGDSMQLVLTPIDNGGNAPNTIVSKSIELVLPNGFHFSFSEQLSVEVLADGSEKAVIQMSNQSVALNIGTAHAAGDYNLGLAGIDKLMRLINGQWQQANELPVTLNAAQANDYVITPVSLLTDTNLGSRADVLEQGDSKRYTVTLVDRFGNLVTKVNVSGQQANTNYIVNVVNTQNNNVLGSNTLLSGQTTIDVVFSEVGTHRLQLQAEETAPVGFVKNFSEHVNKKLPHVTDSVFEYGLLPHKPSLVLTFSEPVEITEPADLTTLLELSNEESQLLSIESYVIDANKLSIVYNETLPLGKVFGLNTAGSLLTGVADQDALFAQQLSINSADIFIEDVTGGYQIEATDLKLKIHMRTDKIISTSSLTWSNGTQSAINLAENEALITLPWNPDNAADVDLTPLTLAVAASFTSGESAILASELSIQLLSQNGDYDNDGLSNISEHLTSVLNPLLADTDGNGISDDIDDYDQDGLDNGFEINYGTDITSADSDSDGLSDAQEHQLGTIAVGEEGIDSDQDGIPDFVEVNSFSDPLNPEEALIDPFYITELKVTETHVEFEFVDGPFNYMPEMTAVFQVDSYQIEFNVSGL